LRVDFFAFLLAFFLVAGGKDPLKDQIKDSKAKLVEHKYPVVHREIEEIGLVTLDAHFDMRDTDQGLSNGNPVRVLFEDGLPGANIAQVGLEQGRLLAGLKLPFDLQGRLSFQMHVGIPIDTPRDLKAYRLRGNATFSRLIVAGLAMADAGRADLRPFVALVMCAVILTLLLIGSGTRYLLGAPAGPSPAPAAPPRSRPQGAEGRRTPRD